MKLRGCAIYHLKMIDPCQKFLNWSVPSK